MSLKKKIRRRLQTDGRKIELNQQTKTKWKPAGYFIKWFKNHSGENSKLLQKLST